MNSIEKIHALADDFSGPPTEDAEPFELALRTAVMTLGPMFIDMLPEDPAMLDAALEDMARKLLELRSDGSAPLALQAAAPAELPAGD